MRGGAEGAGSGGERRVLFLYTGQYGSYAPRDVTDVRADPSVGAIREGAFEDCRRLANVELCEGIGRIGDRAFAHCVLLGRVEVPPGVEAIGAKSFFFCTRLEDVRLRAGLEGIGEEAFMHCTILKHVTIPSTVRDIGDRAFYSCYHLTGALELCEGLERLGKAAFYDCKHLRRVNVPSSVEVIDSRTFYGCQRLEKVTLCEGLGQIGKYAFSGCGCMKVIEIPSTVRLIGSWAFQYCHQLEVVEFCEGVLQIDDYAFHRCKSLSHVKIPSTVKTIGCRAFNGCLRLEGVELLEGIERIEASSFSSCASLRRIRIPSTVVKIGSFAFYSCGQLLTVELGEGVDDFAASAFRGCPLLRNLAIPASARAAHGFEGCRDLLKLFGSPGTIDDRLRSRFVGLPVHELCYYQSHRSTKAAMDQLKTNGSAPNGADESLGSTGTIRNMQDCLGMTPLHILACSSKQNLDLYRYIIDHHPLSLITEDKWGCLPILYAIWGSSPHEIIQLLIARHKSNFPNRILNWDTMIQATCRAGLPFDTIRLLLSIHQSSFSEQVIDWQYCARELTIHCLIRCDLSFRDHLSNWGTMMEVLYASHADQELIRSLQEIRRAFFPGRNGANWRPMCEALVGPLKGWWRPGSSERSLLPFQFLVTYRILERINAIGVKKWRSNIKTLVERIGSSSFITSEFDIIHSRLVSIEHEYRQLEDAVFLLELALWKLKIDESLQMHCDNGRKGDSGCHKLIDRSIPQDGQLVYDYASMKGRCRIHCGANIVIPNVLPYLVVE